MIQLYMRSDCPFCIKVKNAVQQMGLKEGSDYEIINAAQGTPGRAVVIKVGGKEMVPFLIDGDHSMYESSDIITYIKEKFLK